MPKLKVKFRLRKKERYYNTILDTDDYNPFFYEFIKTLFEKTDIDRMDIILERKVN